MSVEIVTKEDLEMLKVQLLKELVDLMQKPPSPSPWLKSDDVQKLLKISPGTLQNLRLKGILKFTKVGGALYYKQEDIEKILERGMTYLENKNH